MHNPVTPSECLGEIFVVDKKIKSRCKFDEGILLKGVSLYEVIKIKDKTPLFAEDHIQRLFNSAKVAGAESCPNASLIKENLQILIANNNDIKEGNIRILMHFSGNIKERPHVYSYYIPHYYPSVEEYTSGVSVVPVHIERQSPHSKCINIKFRSFISDIIKKEKAYEALLVNKAGFITEGSKSNFFVIKDNKIITPPEKDVLPGITRKHILNICRIRGIDFSEAKIHFNEKANFDSCFLSGTSPGILAVKCIGATIFNHDHPVLKQISMEHELLVDNYIKNNKSQFNLIK